MGTDIHVFAEKLEDGGEWEESVATFKRVYVRARWRVRKRGKTVGSFEHCLWEMLGVAGGVPPEDVRVLVYFGS